MEKQTKTDHVRTPIHGGGPVEQGGAWRDVLTAVIACLLMAALGVWVGYQYEPEVLLMVVLFLGPVFALAMLAGLARRQWHGRARRLAVPGYLLVLLVLFGLLWGSFWTFV